MNFNSHLESLKTYEAGKPIELVVREFGINPSDIIKLASNENPNGCSLKVQDAVSKIISKMSMYPDDSMYKLKDALALKYGVDSKEIIIGSGSDQVIEFLIHAKAHKGSKILMNSITFAMYEIYAKQVGAEVVRTASLKHNMDEFYEAYKTHKPSIIFLCTPNNPTGDAIDAKEVYDFVQKIDQDTLVVIDGAYMEYASYKDDSMHLEPSELIKKFNNVIYLGTFSKAYGLGGMRVGYGISNKNIIETLYKLRPPFNITTLSLEAASVALEDEEFVKNSIELSFDQMKRYEAFADANSIKYIPSYTNFITLLFSDKQDSTQISQNLLQQGMIVRNLKSYNMNAIRVTIGKSNENDRFFELIQKLI